MARIPYPTDDQIKPRAQAFLEKLPDLNVFRALAWSPAALRGFVRMGNGLLYQGTLDPVLREQVIVRVGHRCEAAYEVAQHIAILKSLGAPDDAAQQAHPDTPLDSLPGPLRAALMLADSLAVQSRADDAAWEAIQAHFEPEQAVELVVLASYYMMVARVVSTLDIELEPEDARGLPME